MTGEQIKSDIYIGPTYYMRLKQMVKDKINYRSQGPRTQLTRQTVQGRANDGGLRVGEMERDGILGHGAAHFLNESLMVRGDEYHMAVCNKSGMIAIYNPNQNLFMSPMVDGPIQYSGSLTDANAADAAGATGASVIHMTKFGRSFSIVRIPYCLKLLMQELLVMNVQMRIITEDNIDQLPSMSYSNNVYKVLKDGKGAMGVDDIIERNRLAAGLRPRDMAAARKNDSAAVGTVAGEDEEEEAAIGSRVYLPSRSEEDDAGGAAAAGMGRGAAAAAATAATFDPDEHPEELIMDLDIDTKQSIRNLGWRFALKDDIARQMRGQGRGSGGDAEPLKPSDITSEDLVLESVIMDKNGEPTERWTISGRQWTGDYPTRFPDGWLSEMLMYPDDTPISPSEMVDELRKIRKPLNWVLAIITLIERYTRRKMKSPVEGDNVAMAENLRNIETNTTETARVSGEIDRAKREGNVAEEERLKVQMTRLTDERVKLDAIRREMDQDAATSILPMTPEFSSSSTPAGEVDADQVRGAVASFNAKMLEKYGDNDQEIPESSDYTPRTPMSPAYSSMFEGDEQRGGSGMRQRGSGTGTGTGKYIPQIPMGVVDNYLRSKYGGSSGGGSGGGTSAGPGIGMNSGFMTGSAGFPTMNIPIVATMPMAGMMPIQQQSGGGGGGGSNVAGQAQGQAPTPTQGQGQGPAQVGGGNGGGPEPNAQGVKTFSIKL